MSYKGVSFTFKRSPFWALSKKGEKRLLASSCHSVRLSALNNSARNGSIFMKFDV